MNKSWIIGLWSLLLLVSCNNAKEKQLSRKWKVWDISFEKTDSSHVGHDALQDGGEDMQKQMIEGMLGYPEYQLNEDGSCLISHKGSVNKGSWKLQAGGKELLIVNERVKPEDKEEMMPMIIEQLSDTSMTLLLPSPQSSYKVRYRLSAAD